MPETGTSDEAEKVEDATDEVEFQLPEFDEEEYIREELRDARLAVVILFYAAIVAAATRAVEFAVGGTLAGAFVGLFGLYGLKQVFRALRVDLSEFSAKNWLATGGIYLVSWLGFWTLYLNPPFS